MDNLPSQTTHTCPISVTIPTYNRAEILGQTLKKILQCNPLPDEIIIHIDGNDKQTEQFINQNFNNIKILRSEINIGPGGGRNLLIKASRNEIVASFDDDSYPIDQDYFARLLKIFQTYPDVSLVASAIYVAHQPIEDDIQNIRFVASFEGCGCAYKKSDFLQTEGYLQLQWAYGAEEVDVSIQLHNQNRKIMQTDWLRVYHDTNYQHHKNLALNAANISNVALLAYIRYPLSMWGLAFLQVLNRVVYAVKMQRYVGIITGILAIPYKIWLYRHYRKPVSTSGLQRYLKLRKHPIIIQGES